MQDTYPSRVEGVEQIIPRVEPAVADSELRDKGPLTREQVDSYERDGYLHLEGFYDEKAVAVLQEETDRLRVLEEIRQSEIAVTEPTSGETRTIYAVQTVSDLFSNLSRDSRLLGMIQQLLGSSIYLHQTRLNLKPGFRGKEYYWHSDFETWHAEDGMPAMRAISCSVALTDNLDINAPVMVIPGSHKYFCQCAGLSPDSHYQQSLKRQDYGVPSDDQLEWLTKNGGVVVPKGPAGSIFLFDCNLMHGSNSNITPYPRKNAIFVYNSIENTLVEPFAAEHQRPWFLGNREPEVLTPVDFSDVLKGDTLQSA